MHWDSSWFQVKTIPAGYWKEEKNQRKFLEKLALVKGIKHPRDWANITTKDLLQEGGIQLVKKYGSLFRCLEKVYPGNGFIKPVLSARYSMENELV